ncbi:MAG: hypothetical protein AAGE52_04355 [Myxococcota bacterium]
MIRLAVVCLALSWAGVAAADVGTFNLQTGATQLDVVGETKWRPTLRADFAFDVWGPLQAGAFAQVMASGLPLRSPRLGGGLLVALRPEIPVVRLRPLLEASAGRMQIAIGSGERESAWVTSVAAGLGIGLAPNTFLEARVTHSWLHQLPTNTRLENRTWLVSVGIGVDID